MSIRSFLFFTCFSSLCFSDLPYKIEYIGIESGTVLKAVKEGTQLSLLQKTPPDSLQALRYRAESDIPEIGKILRSQGYYEAIVETEIQEVDNGAKVFVIIDLGPRYTLSSFQVFQKNPEGESFSCPGDTAPEVLIGSPAKTVDILKGELRILEKLSECGHPLASIQERSIIVDGDTKTVRVTIAVDIGPTCYFGPLEVLGNVSVKKRFFEERIEWKEGEPYSSEKISETEKILTETGLFNSVSLTRKSAPEGENRLPVTIDVGESKHKSIYGGISYQTYYGPGATFGWENRNVSGLGRRFGLQGDITKRSHTGVATFFIPNCLRTDQDAVWELRANHLDILPFLERSYRLTARLERRFGKKLRMAFGILGERLFVNASVQNGDYWLLEVPIFLGLNRSDDLLDPQKGYNLEYRAIPTFLLSPDRTPYCTQKFSFSSYIPTDSRKILILAQKISATTILSGTEKEIPTARRLFGGSEEDLRGYAYYSVSPLGEHNKPEGGRSALYYTLETRIRATKNIGVVPFFDLGNVSSKQPFFPSGKWRKSAGLGLRYFSFFGPFRLDIGFPLNPRKGIDKKYRILVSVGQSF